MRYLLYDAVSDYMLWEPGFFRYITFIVFIYVFIHLFIATVYVYMYVIKIIKRNAFLILIWDVQYKFSFHAFFSVHPD